PMRILMLGWEFPPAIAGGLGVACEGLSKALVRQGHEVIFVMPSAEARLAATDAALPLATNELQIHRVPSAIASPYGEFRAPVADEERTRRLLLGDDADRAINPIAIMNKDGIAAPAYGGDVLKEIDRFTARVRDLARREAFDI